MHLAFGGPKSHTANKHPQCELSRENMVQNTVILRQENDFRRLQIYESLYIQKKTPAINTQITGSCRTLKLFSNQSTIHSIINQQNTNSR